MPRPCEHARGNPQRPYCLRVARARVRVAKAWGRAAEAKVKGARAGEKRVCRGPTAIAGDRIARAITVIVVTIAGAKA